MITRLIAIVLAVAWLFVVTFNYYIVHKPFSVENALAILNGLGDVLVAGALLALATVLGRRLTRALNFASPLEAIVFPAGLGLGLLSLATLALGLAGLLNRILFWLVLIAALLLLRDDLRALKCALISFKFPITSRFDRFLSLFITLALLLAFLFALTPPIAWDAQTYHLVEAKVALERGRIAPPPDIPYFSFPSLVEMLFLAAMLLKGDIAAQLLHFAFFLLALGTVFAFARRCFHARVAWLACALLVAVPSLLLIATWAYVDIALAFYAFTAYCVLRIACQSEDRRWFALAGVFAGFAMSVKYTGIIVPFALLVLLARIRLSFVIRHLSFVILVAAPWYLRNWAFTGNPVYPFFFGGIYWDAFRANWFSRFGTGYMNEPLRLLIAPWEAAIYGQEGALGYEATIGPLLLLLLPLLLLQIQNSHHAPRTTHHASRITNHELPNLLIFSLVLYLFWLLGVAQSKLLLQTRLLFAAFPTLALAAAVAFDRLRALDLPQFSLQRFTRLVIELTLGFTAVGYALGFVGNNPLAYLTGFESREEYLQQRLGAYFAAVQFVNTQLPGDVNILLLWEPRSYYIHRAVQPDVLLDRIPHLRWQYRDADTIAAVLQKGGYTHVMLNRGGLDLLLQTSADPITSEDLQVLQTLTARFLKPVYGKIPLQIVIREGKPAVLAADTEPYVVYEWIARGP